LRLVTPPSDPFTMPLPPVAIVATEQPNVFVVHEGRFAGEPMTFEFDSDGRVTGMHLSALGGNRLRKTD
jgi:hypothetical protein